MKKHIEFFARYLGFWMLLFLIMRAMFILFNGKTASQLPFDELLLSFVYGLRLDLSMSAYLTVIPMLIWFIAMIGGAQIMSYVLKFYNIIVIVAVVALCLIDAELYSYWGQKLNAYASSFAKFPKEMLSFSSGVSWGKLIFFITLFSFLVKITYDNVVGNFLQTIAHDITWVQRLSFLPVFTALLFLMIRGNIGMSPINQSFVYYSDKPFLNHAAVNTAWNFLASWLDNTQNETSNPYALLNDSEAQALLQNIQQQHRNSPAFSFSSSTQPNVLFIVLEGWSADVVAYTGGETDITPQLNQVIETGLAYTHFYANGNRTDKGLAAILSGEPALAKSSIINKLQKFNSLPALPSLFRSKGYSTAMVYGGESEFANMKAYWMSSGFERIVDIHDFNKTVLPESWGVHDDEMYSKLLQELNGFKQPFFVSALTLSSHEPYRVPFKGKYTGEDDADKYRNAVQYADDCLGKFFQAVQSQPWYNNTLIFILSDHGHYQPKSRNAFEPARFHIPFAVTGGALLPALRGKKITRFAQQTDLAYTLAQQLQLPNNPFQWGTSLLDTAQGGFAVYTFDDGAGLVSPHGNTVYDYNAKRTIQVDSSSNPNALKTLQAYQQLYYQQYLNR